MADVNTGTYVTAKGKSLIAKAIALGTEIEFTRAAVGAGIIPEYIYKETLTGLIDYKMDDAIASAVKESDKAVISIQASSETVEEDFYITEVGVFANDPDEGEIFFGGMDVQNDTTLMYANGEGSVVKFAEYELILLVGSTATITAIITPGAYASREDVEELQNPEFEDYTGETVVPSAETALSNIKSGKNFKELWQNIKAFCMGVVTLAKISQNGAITEVGKLVLDAIEKNPDIAGTLAYMIKQNQTNISKLNAEYTYATYEKNLQIGQAPVTMEVDISKSGYKPIMYSITYTKSPYISGHVEAFTDNSLLGFYKSDNSNTYDVNFKARVLYKSVS